MLNILLKKKSFCSFASLKNRKTKQMYVCTQPSNNENRFVGISRDTGKWVPPICKNIELHQIVTNLDKNCH